MLNAVQFFGTARERYKIKDLRDKKVNPPWTEDKVFQHWRFCNVHREDDATTRWFARYIRGPLSFKGDKLQIVKATTIFRWFNRIETGEKIKDLLLGEWNSEEARRRLKDVSPVVTGAYIIKGPDGFSKLDGVLRCVDMALPILDRKVSTWGESLEKAWEDLNQVYYLGRFMSYEIVSDLRWTPVLEDAIDINTWANAGPGCARGLGWVLHDRSDTFASNSAFQQRIMLSHMQELLALSKDEAYWPCFYSPWEMREVEHWLCEYDKYRRAESGLKLKRRYACA
jgi:5-hmdU DNA kinase-like protein